MGAKEAEGALSRGFIEELQYGEYSSSCESVSAGCVVSASDVATLDRPNWTVPLPDV